MFRMMTLESKASLSALGATLCAIAIGSSNTSMTHADDRRQDYHHPEKHPLFRLSPVSPIRIFRPNSSLEIAFDVRTRNPVYVMERLKVDDKPSGNRKRHNFYEEQALPEAYRSRNSSYHNSGYDRGHLAPAADFDDPKERLDTYNLTNISPQHHELNRKQWAQLEAWTRQISRSRESSSETYVITGPIWLPQRQIHDKLFEFNYPAIGSPPNIVSVPTHFFKLIAVIKDDTIVEFACFVVPNHVEESKSSGTVDFADYSVRWTDLERVTGLEFFVGLVSPEWKQRADSLVILPPKRQIGGLLGDSAPSSSALIVRGRRGNQAGVRHLCPGGSCLKPKT